MKYGIIKERKAWNMISKRKDTMGKKKMGKKLGSVILSLVMIAGLFSGIVPGTSTKVYADSTVEKTMQNTSLGTGGLRKPNSGRFSYYVKENEIWQEHDIYGGLWSYVYFGKSGSYPLKFRVLDPASYDFGVSEGSLLLDCDNVITPKVFYPITSSETLTEEECANWSTSTIYEFLNGESFLNSDHFTQVEMEAIAESRKAGRVAEDGNSAEIGAFVPLNGEKVFLLDFVEAGRPSYGYINNSRGRENRIKKDLIGNDSTYWLRTMIQFKDEDNNTYTQISAISGRITGMTAGSYTGSQVDLPYGVSPAMNLSLSSILFTTLVEEESTQWYALGFDQNYKINQCYKLTLIDSGITAAVTQGQSVSRAGNTLTIPYSVSGNPDKLSILITDRDYKDRNASLKHYEVLKSGNVGNAGTVEFTLPVDCAAGDKVYIVAEKTNGKYESDYASVPAELNVGYSVSFDATGGTISTTTEPTGPNGKMASLPTPTYEGNIFAGWFTEANGGTQVSTDTVFTGGETVYAHWVPQYTVTFDSNGGNTAVQTAVTDINGRISRIPDATYDSLDSRAFDGWTKTRDGEDWINSATVFDSDTTVYAKWKTKDNFWYGSQEITQDTTIDGLINTANEVGLKIADGVTLTINGTLCVGGRSGNVTVEGPGTLIVKGNNPRRSCIDGNLTILSGNVVVSGKDGGSGESAVGGIYGNVNILGGSLSVKGGNGGDGETVNNPYGWGNSGGNGGSGIDGSVTVDGGSIMIIAGNGGKGGNNSGSEYTASDHGGNGGNAGNGIEGTLEFKSGYISITGGSGGEGGRAGHGGTHGVDGQNGAAIGGPITNEFPGKGWTDPAGTEGETEITVLSNTQVSSSIKKVVFDALFYEMRVTNGNGSGRYLPGTSVTISADEIKNKRFKEWSGTEGLRFTAGDKTTAFATFDMPSKSVNVSALYEDVEEESDTSDVEIVLPVTKKVTFKVKNGAWDDGTTDDKTVLLEGYSNQVLKMSADQIPAVGHKPSDRYKEGSWDTVPSTETAITSAVTYTYTYAEETTDPDSGKTDPTDPNTDSGKTDPTNPDPVKPDPVNPDPVNPDPVKPDPVEPGQKEPGGSEVKIETGNGTVETSLNETDADAVVVTGLDDAKDATSEAKEGKKVDFKLIIKPKGEKALNEAASVSGNLKTKVTGAFKPAADESKIKVDVFSIDIKKSVDNSADIAVDSLEKVIEIAVSYDLSGGKKFDPVVIREHTGREPEEFAELTGRPVSQEYFRDAQYYVYYNESDPANSTIYIYSKEFSTYVVAYSTIPGQSTRTKVAPAGPAPAPYYPGGGGYYVPSEEPDTKVEAAPAAPVIPAVKVHRLYESKSGAHFFTVDESEYKTLKEAGYVDEGYAFDLPKTSDAPVYRLFDAGRTGEHFFTDSVSKKEELQAKGWVYEGIAFFSDERKTHPVYRMKYKAGTVIVSHLTASEEERKILINAGWTEDGIVFYAK